MQTALRPHVLAPRASLFLGLANILLTPLAAQTAAPAPINPTVSVSDDVIVLEPFVVNAFSDERNRSVAEKRNAASIGDFISSDQLGQFVENNIGNVVERLPGVYTSGAGQSGGSGISIRGLGGGFNSLQVDGARLPSNQGGTRGVSIDNIPAELIGAIEIFKAPTPDKEADSIGGLVNVETKSGLDLRRALFASRFVHGFDSWGGGYSNRASASYSGRLNDQLGIFFGLTYASNQRQRDEVRSSPGDYVFNQLVAIDPSFPRLTEDAGRRVFTPGRVDFRRTIQSQQNLGANLNLDWQATETFRLSLRTFVTRFDEQRPQVRSNWRIDRSAGNDPLNRTFPHREYVFLDQSDGTFYFGDEQRLLRRVADQDETERIERVQLEGRHLWHDATLDYSASFARSRRDLVNDTFIWLADRIQVRANFSDPFRPRFDLIRPGEFYHFSHINPPIPLLDDPNSYGGTGPGRFVNQERRAEIIDAKDELNTYSINYRKLLGNDTAVQVGARLRTQDKVNDRDFVIGPGFTFAAANANFVPQDGFLDGLADLGLFPTYGSIRAQNPVPPRQFAANILGGNPSNDNRRDSTVEDLSASEDILGLYAMGSRTFGPVTVLGGVRWERTKSAYSGFTADVTGNPAIDTPRRVAGGRTYDDFYPSVHANWLLRENLLLRAAIGRTLARPEFQDLTPSSYGTLSVDSASGAALVNLQRGNANLRPTQSTNYDLSLEWYFADGGLFSVAIFHKDLKNWIYRSTVFAPPEQFPEYAAIPNLVGVQVNSTLNGDSAAVSGVELNFEKSIGAGFSLGANYTALTFDVNADQTGLTRVPGQSDGLLRATLSYENPRFIARIAYRDSGNILDSQVSFSDAAAIAFFEGLGLGRIAHTAGGGRIVHLGLYEMSAPALEFTGEVRVTKQARFFVQVNNLLERNPTRLLEKDDRFPEKNEHRSWTALVGLRLNF
jgi:TonB-dependent receptor